MANKLTLLRTQNLTIKLLHHLAKSYFETTPLERQALRLNSRLFHESIFEFSSRFIIHVTRGSSIHLSLERRSIRNNATFVKQPVALKLLVSLDGRRIACSAGDRQTDKPSTVTLAPRVFYKLRGDLMLLNAIRNTIIKRQT